MIDIIVAWKISILCSISEEEPQDLRAMPKSNHPQVLRIGGMEWHRNTGGVRGSGGSSVSNELRSPSPPNVFFRPEQQDKENAPLCM